jgi:formylglycine-generating enzyme required for sulfatase activity
MGSLRRQRWLVLLIVLGGLAASLPLAGQESSGEKYALLVGIRKYSPNQLKDLPFAENDVVELAKVLRQHGYREENVVVLSNSAGSEDPRYLPLGQNIRKELQTLLKRRRSGDSVLVAFAGHGLQFKDDDKQYFCPFDTNLKDRSTLVAITEVYAELEKCPAKYKLLLVDACRNEPASRNAARDATDQIPPSATRPELPEPPGGVAAFFSCSKRQVAYENEKLKHGLFFHFVIEGLKGAAATKEQQVTLGSLSEYVTRRVEDYARAHHDGAEQVPELMNHTRGVMTLAAMETTAEEIENAIGMKLRRIPAGRFTMGSPKEETARLDSEGPQHEVEITRAFYLGKFEVTQGQYRQVMGENPSYFSQDGKGKEKVAGKDTDNFPVDSVSWEDAVAFCRKLSEMPKERAAGRVYHLPTEAEWEYACRGGATSYQIFHFGNSASSLQANFVGHTVYGKVEGGPWLQRTTTVGSYRPNGYGLYDMHGNVGEWCADWHSKDYYANSDLKDPQGPQNGDRRVLRGGSCGNDAWDCRSAYRIDFDPGTRDPGFGFRVVWRPGARTP